MLERADNIEMVALAANYQVYTEFLDKHYIILTIMPVIDS
jgi:hypothetical protein